MNHRTRFHAFFLALILLITMIAPAMASESAEPDAAPVQAQESAPREKDEAPKKEAAPAPDPSDAKPDAPPASGERKEDSAPPAKNDAPSAPSEPADDPDPVKDNDAPPASPEPSAPADSGEPEDAEDEEPSAPDETAAPQAPGDAPGSDSQESEDEPTEEPGEQLPPSEADTMMSAAVQALDAASTLTVRFDGISVDSIVLEGANTYQQKNKSNSVQFVDIPNGEYTLTLTKGGMKHTESIAVNESREHVVPVCDLLIKFPGISQLDRLVVSAGGKEVATKTYIDKGEYTLKVFQDQTYEIRLAEGGMTSEGNIAVGAVTSATYDAPMCKLTVEFPGISQLDEATLSVGGVKAVGKGYAEGGKHTFSVFQGQTYDVYLREGGMTHSGSITIGAETEAIYKTPMCLLTIEFPGISQLDAATLSVDGVKAASKGFAEGGKHTFSVFQGQTYDITLKENNMTHKGSVTITDQDKHTYDAPMCKIKVEIPGLYATSITALWDDKEAMSKPYVRDYTELTVFQDYPYAVRLKIDGKEYLFSDLDCRTDEITLSTAGLTVNFPGLKEMDSIVLTSASGKTYKQSYKANSATFASLPNGKYTITLTEGGMTHTANIVVVGATVYDVPLCELKVTFDGISQLDKAILSVGGKEAVAKGYAEDGEHTFTVFRNQTYDIFLKEGGMSHTGRIKIGNEASATYNAPMCKLTVTFEGITELDKAILSVGGIEAVTKSYAKNGKHTFSVFQGQTYDITLKENNMTHKGSVTITDQDKHTYDAPMCKIKVEIPGLYATSITALWDDKEAMNKPYVRDYGELTVFQDYRYAVRLKIDGKEYLFSDLDCRYSEITLGTSTLTVNFPGVKEMDSIVLTSASGKTYKQSYKANSATFASLPNGKYTITLTEGGMKHTANVVVVGAAVYDVPLCLLTVNFPGITELDKAILSVGGIEAVTKSYAKNGTHTFSVFQGQTYDVYLREGGMIHRGSIAIGTETEATYNAPMCLLTITFPGITELDKAILSVGGIEAVTKSYAKNGEHTFSVFQGQTYDITLKENNMTHKGSVTITDQDKHTYDAPMCKIKVEIPGLYATSITALWDDKEAMNKTYVNDYGELVVFQDYPYAVRLKIDDKEYLFSDLNCRIDEVTLNVPQSVSPSEPVVPRPSRPVRFAPVKLPRVGARLMPLPVPRGWLQIHKPAQPPVKVKPNQKDKDKPNQKDKDKPNQNKNNPNQPDKDKPNQKDKDKPNQQDKGPKKS